METLLLLTEAALQGIRQLLGIALMLSAVVLFWSFVTSAPEWAIDLMAAAFVAWAAYQILPLNRR